MDQLWPWLSIIFLCAGLMVSAVERKLNRVKRSLARVECSLARVVLKLDSATDHLGIPRTEPEADQVAALLRQGKKIRAIKVYRDATGVGLKEAKDTVERMTARS